MKSSKTMLLKSVRPAARAEKRLRGNLLNGVFRTKRNRSALLACLLAGIGGSIALASPIDNSASYTANTLAPNDDGSTGAIPLGFTANFFGTNYTNVFVNNNGNVTFNAALGTYTPYGLTSGGIPPIIAPFFADVDTSSAGSPVTYGTGTFGGHSSFGVDYINVDYFASSVTHTNRNSFQVILVNRSDTGAGNFDIYFNYGQIQWEAGEASGSDPNGRGGTCAVAGYSNGTGNAGTYAQLTGSLTCGAFLDGGPNSLKTGTNDGTPGQFYFAVRGGVVVGGGGVPTNVATFGVMRQLATAIARHRDSIIGFRMDGLSGGGDQAALSDSMIKEAQAGLFGDDHLKVFGAVDVSRGAFVPMTGITNEFSATHIDLGVDDTFAIPGGAFSNIRVGAIAGIAFADSGPSAAHVAIGDTRVKSRTIVNLSLYGGGDFLDHGYVDLATTYSFLRYSSNRTFASDVFTGKDSAHQLDVSLRGGYDFPIDIMMPDMSLSAGPLAVTDYTYGELDAFNEGSATAAATALKYPSANYHTWTTQLGGRVNFASNFNGATYGLTVSTTWQHQFEDSPTTPIVPTVGTLLTSLAPFSIRHDDAAHVGARLWGTAFVPNLTVAVDYNGLFGRDTHEHSVVFQAKYQIY